MDKSMKRPVYRKVCVGKDNLVTHTYVKNETGVDLHR